MLLIKNGLVKTMAGNDIENGQVLIDGDKIAAIGKKVDAPSDVEVFDAKGLIVSPGFIDAHCHVGLQEEGVGREGQDLNEIGDPVSPQIRGRDGINPLDDALKEAIEEGVTIAVTGPGSANSIGGTFLAMKLYGKNVDKMIIKDPVGMKCAFGENPKRVYGVNNKLPFNRMGNVQNIRECLIKTKEYLNAKERSKDDASKMPKYDAKLEAMIPVINKEIPLKAHAHRADDIMSALSVAKQFDVDITLDHCTEGHLIVDELVEAGKPALLGPNLIGRSKIELRNATFDNYRILNEAGVKICVITDANVIPLKYLPLCAGLAVKHGLKEQEAWKAITINPAEVVGINDRVGSLETGKDADVAIFKGNPLTDVTYHTVMTIIDGKIVYKNNKYID